MTGELRFRFRLALSMGRTVGELMRSMSSLEYSYWLALAGLEPLGQERGDWHAALVASTLANVNRAADSDAVPIDKFLLFSEIQDEGELSDEEIQRRLLAAFPMNPEQKPN